VNAGKVGIVFNASAESVTTRLDAGLFLASDGWRDRLPEAPMTAQLKTMPQILWPYDAI
jgi:hypothetical protein